MSTHHTGATALALSLAMALPAQAEIRHESDAGYLSFGGDVELDINVQNRHAVDGPIFLEDNVSHRDEYDQSGRVLLDLGGGRHSARHYARFRAQPLLQTNGNFALDDAWLAIGSQRGTELKVGRFEAFDLFPKGQDVFVDFSGDTSDSLYRDGQGYLYQAREGRGRGGDSGQISLSHDGGDFHAEVATLFGDRRDLFDSDTYHGYAIDPDNNAKNSFIVRPVLAWSPGPWTLAVGGETNLVDDAILDERGADISDRQGYGSRLSYDAGGWGFNANLAYLEAHEEENLTLGLNALWRGMGVGYIHARNAIDDVKPGTNGKAAFTMPGRYTIDTLYASYHFADMLAIDDLSVYLGAYFSRLDHRESPDAEVDRYGTRLRFKYHF